MDLKSLSNEQLDRALQELQRAGPRGAEAADQLQELLHELQVFRMELEMQNRALRETQSDLENSIRRYTDLYDYSPVGYVTMTRSGQIEEANLTAVDLLQTSRDRLIGRHFRRYVEEADGERVSRHLEEAILQGTAVLDVTLQRGPQQPALPVQLTSRLNGGRDEPRVRTTITDVSLLKSVQQQLEELNREQEAFSYSISHDLRTPLITISNLSTLLLSEFAAGLDDTGQDCLRRIHFAAVRMDRLLTDLLEYSRISRSSLVTSVVDVERVLDDVVGQHFGMIEAGHGKISIARPIPNVQGSPEAIRQILANLLTNALKFVKPGETPHVEIASHGAGDRVIITVRDHGIGIPEESQQRVFGMFERLHAQSEYPGTGVGLAIVRRAVERIGGRIWLESHPGEGTTFFVELRRACGE